MGLGGARLRLLHARGSRYVYTYIGGAGTGRKRWSPWQSTLPICDRTFNEYYGKLKGPGRSSLCAIITSCESHQEARGVIQCDF